MEALAPQAVVPDHNNLKNKIILREPLSQILLWQDQEGLHYHFKSLACRHQFLVKVLRINIKPRHNIRTLQDQVVQCPVDFPHLLDFQEDLLDMNIQTWCQCVQEDLILIWSTKITKILWRKTQAFNRIYLQWDLQEALTKCLTIAQIYKANHRWLLTQVWCLRVKDQWNMGHLQCQWRMKVLKLNALKAQLSELGINNIHSLETNFSLIKIEDSQQLPRRPNTTLPMLSQSSSCPFFRI